MLVCPQCQFENPNTNNFCQECGTSLTHNTCGECGTLVPFHSLQCQECGAWTGVVWWVIVRGQGKLLQEYKLDALPTLNPAKSDPKVSPSSSEAVYLDPQHRYLLLDILSGNHESTLEQQAMVLDCQPFQVSPLEALIQQALEPMGGLGGLATLPDSRSGILAAIPEIAQPYFGLHNLAQVLPAVRDAWQQDGQEFLLLEDRSHLPCLLDVWLEDDQPLPLLQILHSLYEMVELWEVLEPWKCLSSLLDIDNLRLDEDQTLCLQRLLPDPDGRAITLQDLGEVWQVLFAQSQRTQLGAITLLLSDLEMGKMTRVDELRSRLEQIGNDLQATPDVSSNTRKLTAAPDPLAAESDVVAAAPSQATDVPVTAADLSTATASTRLEISLEELTAMAGGEGEGDNDDMPTIVLPMQLFSLEDAGRTDIGRQRDHNEDYFGIETQMSKLESPSSQTVHARNLYILCDGMGGHAGGEVASALAVDTLRQYFRSTWQSSDFSGAQGGKLPTPDELTSAVQAANTAIYTVNQQNACSGSGRMGTTLVMLLLQDTEAAVVHVGDSRVYRFTRKRGLEQITVDHEVGQREIQRGVEPDIAYGRPDAYQLTQALGPRDDSFIKPDIQYVELNEDTLFLLCSDGLTDNNLLEKYCQTHVEPLLSSRTNLSQGVSQLIDLANQYNGHDNITAIAIRAKVRPNLDRMK